ncbi:adenylate/guanylate cyclase domain-containing protein [Promineifilum sp.]|uniref:adenylate/guanylate cyclase domain-containing protein n=1 Tax=Promineifilum sp. TaxID=2664178 RepID=UPI0035B397FA
MAILSDTPKAWRPTWSARLLNLFGPLVFSGSRPDDSEEERLRKAQLMGGSLLLLPVAVTWAALYALYHEPLAAGITLGYAAIMLGAMVYLARAGRRAPLGFIQWFCPILLPFLLTIVLGGIAQSSALILGALMSPLGAMLYHNRDAATRYFVAYVLLIVVTSAINPYLRHDNNLPEWLILTLFALNVIIVSSLAFFQTRAFVHQRDNALWMLRLEQEKSEALLCNILPESIAGILKNDQRTIAERFDAVSILFADVVGFTPLSTTVEAAEMVNLLNEIYTHFDNVVDKYDLEKIRTMGDGYMVASGVPTPRPDHAHALAGAALEMMDFLKSWASPRAAEIQFRMGINTGPVLAGVIGRKKFSYDVWGDPVNIASRMESHGQPGKIQVGRPTYELIKDDFILEPRGTIDVKGIGEMETWFLLGRR